MDCAIFSSFRDGRASGGGHVIWSGGGRANEIAAYAPQRRSDYDDAYARTIGNENGNDAYAHAIGNDFDCPGGDGAYRQNSLK